MQWIFWDGEHGLPASELSAFQNIVDEYTHQDFGCEERFVTDKRGFCMIFNSMTNEINNLSEQYKKRL